MELNYGAVLVLICLSSAILVAESSLSPTGRRNSAVVFDERHRKTCFSCPPDQTLIADQNCNCSVMRVPPIQPCNLSKTAEKRFRTKVIRGPSPGTLVPEGSHETVLRVYNDGGTPVHTCRYTNTVKALEQCPSLHLSGIKVNCSSANYLGSSCTFSCRRGFQISGPATAHCLHHDNGQVRWTPLPEKCSKSPALFPIRHQCRDVNVTLEAGQEFVLPHPEFKARAGYLNISCSFDQVREAGVFQRTCRAVHYPSQATTSCSYLVRVQVRSQCRSIPAPDNGTLRCTTKNTTIVCNIQCAQNHSITIQQLENRQFGNSDVIYCQDRFWKIGSHQLDDPVILCEEDPPGMDFVAELSFRVQIGSCQSSKDRLEPIWQAAKNFLLARNADACLSADCKKLEFNCPLSSSHENNELEKGAFMEITWTVSANYSPLEDYYYDAAQVPEAEILIEKIQVETARIIKSDPLFHAEMKKHGALVVPESFRIGMLDLVCHLPGYEVDEATNTCRRCPAGSFQHKAKCKPCPRGFFQDLPGQVSCRKCETKDCVKEKAIKDPESGSHPLRHGGRKMKAAELKGKVTSRTKSKGGLTVTEEDPCVPNPCMAGGTCVIVMKQAKCKCRLGSTGSQCEIPQCPTLYCFHGGTCSMKHSKLSCSCPPGFKGKRCEFLDNSSAKGVHKKRRHQNHVLSLDSRLGYCASNPCRNGGRCVDNSHAGYFTCKCVGPFHGPTCELTSPCSHGNCD